MENSTQWSEAGKIPLGHGMDRQDGTGKAGANNCIGKPIASH